MEDPILAAAPPEAPAAPGFNLRQLVQLASFLPSGSPERPDRDLEAGAAADPAVAADATTAAKAASASSDHNSEGGKNPNARDPQPSNASNGRDRRPRPVP